MKVSFLLVPPCVVTYKCNVILNLLASELSPQTRGPKKAVKEVKESSSGQAVCVLGGESLDKLAF